MTQSRRKFAGGFLLLASIVVWSIGAIAIYEGLLMAWPGWALVLAFCLIGLSWLLPAGWLIRWMARPDA